MECLFCVENRIFCRKLSERTENIMSEFINVSRIFGENVFNDTVMQERLPKKVYKELKKTIEEGKELEDRKSVV